MPFGLTNTPDDFQAYINDCLLRYNDDFAVCNLDDILMYSTNEEEHKDLIRKVLERIGEIGHNCKAEKYRFGVSELGCLGLVISPDGIAMESDRISMIEEWPTTQSVRDVQVLLVYTNFFWRIIRKYAKITSLISDLLKKAENSRKSKQINWEWTRDAKLAFRKLNRAFTGAPIQQDLKPAQSFILPTDASGFTIPSILNQYDGFGFLRPVNIYSQQCSGAEQNNNTYVRELLAIVETLKQWPHNLKVANHKVLIQCDHKNLEYIQTSKVLSTRQD